MLNARLRARIQHLLPGQNRQYFLPFGLSLTPVKSVDSKQKEKEELEKKYKELFAEKNFGFKRLMKAFPDMTSREQNESLQKYKKYFNIRRNKNDQNSEYR